jgi:hypothetical protein
MGWWLEALAAAVFLQRIGHIGLGHGNRVALFPLGQLKPLVQLLFKIAITHLLEDVGVPRVVLTQQTNPADIELATKRLKEWLNGQSN